MLHSLCVLPPDLHDRSEEDERPSLETYRPSILSHVDNPESEWICNLSTYIFLIINIVMGTSESCLFDEQIYNEFKQCIVGWVNERYIHMLG
jgi:hypothetical protein